MDFAEVANFSNMSFIEDISPSDSPLTIAQEVVFTIFVGIGIIVNITAIYTINHFKKLRTVPNLLFSNWALAYTFSLLSTPSLYRIVSIIDHSAMSPEFVCVIVHLDLIFQIVAILFMDMICLEWVIASYVQKLTVKFKKCYKFVVVVLWGLAFILSIISIRICLKHIPDPSILIILFIVFLLFLLLTISLQVVRCIQRYRKINTSVPNLMLIIATTYSFCWLLGLSNYFIDIFYLRILQFVFEIFVFSSPIINFVLMFKYNKDFQACTLQLLRRPNERYTESITEFEDIPQNSIV